MIGPFRGGRTVGAAGIPGQPNVFYIGVNNGGVWKTTDYGHTWKPIFDDQPTGSIGTLAIAPSNPNIIYVGSGEGLQRPDLSTGDGVYKSIDGGKTWSNVGLKDGQQIPAILVDPQNPDRLFVGVLGHPYGANQERGVFRSADGGKTWDKVLYKDENTGAIALAFDPTNAQIVYAVLWAARQGPWENGSWQGTTSGLFKSTDGGNTWNQLTKGLPTTEQGLGRIGIAVAPNDRQCLYALVDAPRLGGLYRSNDAGESWQLVNQDARIWGRGSDFAEVQVDPKNKDLVYIANTGLYRSTDGGKNFTCIKGAPGGDDYHSIWINPTNPKIILLATDQGAVITVNGGETWSSWYNQPTAQFYHVSTDNQFPYWVYGGQQESGSAGVSSRGRDGQITFRDWHPVGVEEYGYAAADPLNPSIIYGGKITRYDRTTGQVQNIAPDVLRTGKYRFLRTAPVLFAPTNPHVLYFAGNVLFKTTTGGQSWDIISPDLTREQPDVPDSIGIFRSDGMARMARRGVIYTVAPSYKETDVIWVGTDDGLIHITRDGGKNWKNITPPGLTSWSKVSLIDAGRFDAGTAYAAVNRIRLSDQRPHIYRTHDYGATWQEIIKGLPDNAPVNAVREDSVRKGLLFCGTERAIHVSFNDGDDWQSLRLNMPATSMRDLVVHQDDLVVGTHGRSFWILDDITPLRQVNTEVAGSSAYLFKPQLAHRVRWNLNTDTPLPPEEPAGQNPPDGAIINYYLRDKTNGRVTLEVLDSAGSLVRRFTSEDRPDPINEKELPIATSWIRPFQRLSNEPGMHRFIWDMHYPPPEGRRSYPMTAIIGNTPSVPNGPWVFPGEYSIKLTVNGQTYSQPLAIKMDPRIRTSAEDLALQYSMSMLCWKNMVTITEMQKQLRSLRTQLAALSQNKAVDNKLREVINALNQKADTLDGAASPRRGGGRRSSDEPSRVTFASLNNQFSSMLAIVQGADVKPTSQLSDALKITQSEFITQASKWQELLKKDIPELNKQLQDAKLPLIQLTKQ